MCVSSLVCRPGCSGASFHLCQRRRGKCDSDVHPDALEINPVTRYNLVANVCHQGKPHDGFYKAQVLHAVRARQPTLCSLSRGFR